MKTHFQHTSLPIEKVCLGIATTVIGLGILGITNGAAHANTMTVNKTRSTLTNTKTSST